MAVKVTIETPQITISKEVADKDLCDDARVVAAIDAVVDAYDAAHDYKSFSVRKHLQDALNHGSKRRTY